MKKIIAVITLGMGILVAPIANATDKSIMFEFGFGFGDSGEVSRSEAAKKKLDLTKCRNRDTGGMTFFAVRLRSDDVELHGATWFHDEEIANCDRDSYAIGLGYVFNNDDDERNLHSYVSWTPGIAYTWGENKNFTGQTSDGTNYRLENHWQIFNRLALGVGTNDGMAEVAVNYYGLFETHHGESFVTMAVGLKDLDKEPMNTVVEPPVVEPPVVEPPVVEPPVVEPPVCTKKCDKEDDDNGHGNDEDRFDESNPGKSKHMKRYKHGR